EARDHLVADPALLLDRADVVVLAAEAAQVVDQAADPLLLGFVRAREREDEVVVDLAEEEGLGEGGDGLGGGLLLLHRCGLHRQRPYIYPGQAASTRSAIRRASGRADVAAGEGALRTWSACSVSWTTKSSTRVPSRFIAWARTPDGPGSTSPG